MSGTTDSSLDSASEEDIMNGATDSSLNFASEEDILLGDLFKVRSFMRQSIRSWEEDRQVEIFTDKELSDLNQKIKLTESILERLEKLIEIEDLKDLI